MARHIYFDLWFARLLSTVTLGLGLLTAGNCFAQSGEKVIMYNGFPPGAAVDATGRVIASSMSGSRDVIMENLPGAGGNIAAARVERAAPDGRTLLFTAYFSMLTAKAAGRTDIVDLVSGLTPVAYVGPNTLLLIVRPDLPVSNFREFVAYAKSRPGQLNFSSNGMGGAQHLGLEILNARAGLSLVHIPYKGGGPAMQDMLGGRLDVMFATIGLASPHLASGKVKAIAIANNQRSPQYPNLTTISESGLPGFQVRGGMGIFAPPDTPDEIVRALNAEVNQLLGDQRVLSQLEAQGVMVQAMTPEAFKTLLNDETEETLALIQKLGLRL